MCKAFFSRSTCIGVFLYTCAGFNQDCAVNFINAAQGQVLVFEDSVFIEWEEIGPIGFTECRLDRTVFIRCEYRSVETILLLDYSKLFWSICLHAHISSLECATELKFAPFCSS